MITCDRCKKSIGMEGHFQIQMLSKQDSQQALRIDCDLCFLCVDSLDREIKDFLNPPIPG